MGIETIGTMTQILEGGATNKWARSADLKTEGEFNTFSTLSFDKTESTKSFSEMLSTSIGDLNNLQKDANTAIQKLATGESKNIHETMLAVEQAEIAFKTMNQIRLKVLDAYKQIMNMQV